MKSKDTLITPGMTIKPEPAPATPDLGVRRTGNGGPLPERKPADTEVIWAGIEKALGNLSPSDQAKIKARMRKYSAAKNTTVNGIGISCAASDEAKRSREQLASINERIRSFWDANAGDSTSVDKRSTTEQTSRPENEAGTGHLGSERHK